MSAFGTLKVDFGKKPKLSLGDGRWDTPSKVSWFTMRVIKALALVARVVRNAQWQTVCGWYYGLHSLCELMSAVPAAAIECRRCLRDIRKEDRQWDGESTSESNSTVSQKVGI